MALLGAALPGCLNPMPDDQPSYYADRDVPAPSNNASPEPSGGVTNPPATPSPGGEAAPSLDGAPLGDESTPDAGTPPDAGASQRGGDADAEGTLP